MVSKDIMIQMIDVNKWFGNFHVLKEINLTVLKGERIVNIGQDKTELLTGMLWEVIKWLHNHSLNSLLHGLFA